MITLEICCYGAECAVIAEKYGADRIELCSSPAEGGTVHAYFKSIIWGYGDYFSSCI